MKPSPLDRVFLWPYLETRRMLEAVGRSWRRIVVGSLVGWALAVVLGAVALVTLEQLNVVSFDTSDTLGIVIALAGVGLGALGGYATRRVQPAEVRLREVARVTSDAVSARSATRSTAATGFPAGARGVSRPPGTRANTQRRPSRAVRR